MLSAASNKPPLHVHRCGLLPVLHSPPTSTDLFCVSKLFQKLAVVGTIEKNIPHKYAVVPPPPPMEKALSFMLIALI